ncbi:hypothetical protein KCU70_g230, partial [Aureobasidium melanogenum]
MIPEPPPVITATRPSTEKMLLKIPLVRASLYKDGVTGYKGELRMMLSNDNETSSAISITIFGSRSSAPSVSCHTNTMRCVPIDRHAHVTGQSRPASKDRSSSASSAGSFGRRDVFVFTSTVQHDQLHILVSHILVLQHVERLVKVATSNDGSNYALDISTMLARQSTANWFGSCRPYDRGSHGAAAAIHDLTLYRLRGFATKRHTTTSQCQVYKTSLSRY